MATEDSKKKKPAPSSSKRNKHDYAAIMSRAKNRKDLRKLALAAKMARLRDKRKSGKITTGRAARRAGLHLQRKAPTAPTPGTGDSVSASVETREHTETSHE